MSILPLKQYNLLSSIKRNFEFYVVMRKLESFFPDFSELDFKFESETLYNQTYQAIKLKQHAVLARNLHSNIFNVSYITY